MSTNVAISLCVYSNPTQTKYDIVKVNYSYRDTRIKIIILEYKYFYEYSFFIC